MSYLDLGDLAQELEELVDQEQDAEDDPEGLQPTDDDKDRLAMLRGLEDQFFTTMEDYARNESTLIEEIDFENYAQQFADEVGYVQDADSNSLMSYIDWERWADDLKQDYTEVEFDGRTYLIRAY